MHPAAKWRFLWTQSSPGYVPVVFLPQDRSPATPRFFVVLRQQLRISQKRGTHWNEFSEVIHSSQHNRLEIGLNICGTRKVRPEGSEQGRQVLRNNCKEHLFLMLEMPVERALRKPGFPRDLFRCHPR